MSKRGEFLLRSCKTETREYPQTDAPPPEQGSPLLFATDVASEILPSFGNPLARTVKTRLLCVRALPLGDAARVRTWGSLATTTGRPVRGLPQHREDTTHGEQGAYGSTAAQRGRAATPDAVPQREGDSTARR